MEEATDEVKSTHQKNKAQTLKPRNSEKQADKPTSVRVWVYMRDGLNNNTITSRCLWACVWTHPSFCVCLLIATSHELLVKVSLSRIRMTVQAHSVVLLCSNISFAWLTSDLMRQVVGQHLNYRNPNGLWWARNCVCVIGQERMRRNVEQHAILPLATLQNTLGRQLKRVQTPC